MKAVYKIHTVYREEKKLLFNSVEKKICLSVEKKTVPEEASSPPQGR
jgi:hypothetical protein